MEEFADDQAAGAQAPQAPAEATHMDDKG